MIDPLKRLSLRKRVALAVWVVNLILVLALVMFAAR